MIVLGRHRALTHDAWSELAVRAAIDEIAADAVAHFHPETFWPGHPSDDGVGDGNPSFYYGAAGVIWALDYLHRIGATSVAEDFRPVLPKLLERTITNFESNSSADYSKHGSLLFGDMGAALLAMRLAPTPSLADLVHRRAEANNGLPIRELMGGMPGSMVAAIHMAKMTHETRWRGLFELQASRLLADLEDNAARSTLDPGSLWCQRSLSRARSRLRWQRHSVAARLGLVDASAASARGGVCAGNPRSECVAVRGWNNVGPEKQTREAAFHMSALSRCARYGDDICGCAFRCARI